MEMGMENVDLDLDLDLSEFGGGSYMLISGLSEVVFLLVIWYLVLSYFLLSTFCLVRCDVM